MHGCDSTKRLAGGLVVLLAATTAAASPPRVEFDVADQVACREVTTAEFSEANPREKLIEVAFQISSLIGHGREEDLVHYLYRIESPRRTARVVDYLPRTELTSPVVGPMAIEKKQTRDGSLGVSAGGKYDGIASASATASKNRSLETRVHYEMLPPKELLAASGTIHRGGGVYFKLRPSKQTTLEGARQFVCMLRVPEMWRGEVMTIHCEAIGYKRGTFRSLDTLAACGTADFRVGLHLQADDEAKRGIRELLEAEVAHRIVLAAHQVTVRHDQYVFPVPGRRTIKTLSDPFLPSSLAKYLTERRVAVASDKLDKRLPKPVHAAIVRLAKAQEQARLLSGNP